MNSNSPDTRDEATELTGSLREAPPLDAELAGEAPGEDANPLLLLVVFLILLAVCWQNWVMGRRADEKSLVPDWLSSRLGRQRSP
jgi:hypothetical protein